MATKTEIQSKINEINNGGLNTAAEVRDVLGTNPSSLLENSYGTEIIETHTTVGGILIPNANFEYSANIIKQGRKVFINGAFECLNSFTTVFSLNNEEYTPSLSLREGYSTNQENEFFKFFISFNPITNNYDFRVNTTLIVGERLSYNINYNTLN